MITAFDIAISRYHDDGTPDISFGTDGSVKVDLGSGNDLARAITVQADGKIVVGGVTVGTEGTVDFAICRVLPDGTLDSSFGIAGKTVTDLGLSTDEVRRDANSA